MRTVNTETKVKYTKDKAIITMDLHRYESLCRGFNGLNNSMDSFSEMLDFHLSEIRNMDNLRWTMRFALGFVEPERYQSDFTIPKGVKK